MALLLWMPDPGRHFREAEEERALRAHHDEGTDAAGRITQLARRRLPRDACRVQSEVLERKRLKEPGGQSTTHC
jgi:hypothetical protein